MDAIKTVLTELLGMFVDDWTFTAMILGWLLVGTRFVPPWLPDQAWAGPVLFLGCAAVLALAVWRRAVVLGRS